MITASIVAAAWTGPVYSNYLPSDDFIDIGAPTPPTKWSASATGYITGALGTYKDHSFVRRYNVPGGFAFTA